MTTSEMTPADFAAVTGNGGGGGFGNGDGVLWLLVLFLFAGFGRGGYGGGYGGGSGGGGDGVSAGFAYQSIDSGIRAIQNGICDSTYAITNSINGVSREIADCCCTTQRAIDGVNFNLAKGFCDIGNVINLQTRDIIDNQNANYRGIMDFMVQSKIDALRTENESLRLRASQADQNAVIRAAIDASTAEIIRRTGNECPVPAYVVPNPNCCYGNPLGVGYSGTGFSGAGYGGSGCGCGCG